MTIKKRFSRKSKSEDKKVANKPPVPTKPKALPETPKPPVIPATEELEYLAEDLAKSAGGLAGDTYIGTTEDGNVIKGVTYTGPKLPCNTIIGDLGFTGEPIIPIDKSTIDGWVEVSEVNFFNSVKIGSNERTYIANTDFEILRKDNIIKITRKSDKFRVYTSLYNTPWWREETK